MPRLATKRGREKIERDKAGVKKGDEKAEQGETESVVRESISKQKGMKRGKRRRVQKGCTSVRGMTRSGVEEGRGSRLRAGQYAQAGHGEVMETKRDRKRDLMDGQNGQEVRGWREVRKR